MNSTVSTITTAASTTTPVAQAMFPDGWWILVASTLTFMAALALAAVMLAFPRCCCLAGPCSKRCRRRFRSGLDRALLDLDKTYAQENDDSNEDDDDDSQEKDEGGARGQSK